MLSYAFAESFGTLLLPSEFQFVESLRLWLTVRFHWCMLILIRERETPQAKERNHEELHQTLRS